MHVIEGRLVLVSFEDQHVMEAMSESNVEVFEPWFESIVPFTLARQERYIRLWVCLTEVPLCIWHVNTFKSIAKCWG